MGDYIKSDITKLYQEANSKLKQSYLKWINDIKLVCPEFIEKERYSNPYYISIPEGWFESSKRILVVGQEGYGTWGCGKGTIPIDNLAVIQNFNKEYLQIQTQVEKSDKYNMNNSPFWKRYRKLTKR